MTATSTSLSTSAYSIVKALLAAEPSWLGADRIWAASDTNQTRFLEALNRCYSDESGLSKIENFFVSGNPEEIQKWATENEIKSSIPAVNAASEIWIGSSFSLTPSWERPGRATQRYVGRTNYKFVTMREGFKFFAPPPEMIDPVSKESNAPVNFAVRITCAGGTSLWLMMVEDGPQNPLDILDLIHYIKKNRCENEELVTKSRLHFPMVELSHEVDLGWLSGLNTEAEDGNHWTVVGGVQKHSLRLDDKGEKANINGNAGFYIAGGGNRTEQATEMIFDMPFLVWTEHKAMRDTLFAAYVTPEDWMKHDS